MGYAECQGCGNLLSDGELFRGDICDSCRKLEARMLETHWEDDELEDE